MRGWLWGLPLLLVITAAIPAVSWAVGIGEGVGTKTDRLLAQLDKNIKRVNTLAVVSDATFSRSIQGGGYVEIRRVVKMTLDLKRNIITTKVVFPVVEDPVTDASNTRIPAFMQSGFPAYLLHPKDYFKAYAITVEEGPGKDEATLQVKLPDGREFPKFVVRVDGALGVVESLQEYDATGQLIASEEAMGFIKVKGVNLPTGYERTSYGPGGVTSRYVVVYSEYKVGVGGKP
jgi:hypothetical protein